ncbi:cytochrome P450 [Kineococcus rubinsiae]|uniref:cytochrome P450 n=1 Tax=Kineococcus rubinsiae TaxID=2609562 RepID=UPI0014305D67|nr:cytochrome P450 [Kineococcus rubinsiae]
MDSVVDLVRQGYPWAPRVRAGRLAAPLRFLGRRSALVGGPEGVRRFYDDRLRRRGAFPPPVKLVLFGPGAVHGLDDAEHHHRKALFVRALDPAGVRLLGQRTEREWALRTRGWSAGPGTPDVVLFDEAVQVLARSVLDWAGVPCPPADVPRRARQLATVVDGFVKPGAAWVRAARARRALDAWATAVVRDTRRGLVQPPVGSALALAAAATDRRGRPLPARRAAVELLNVLRPTVAVAWFVAAAGRALAEEPGWRERIAAGDASALAAFCQEVRRVHPFVPVLAARARSAQDVEGVHVPRGGFVVLDVHGTNHDPRHWPDPDRFDPARFLPWPGRGARDPDTLVPQGGGDVATGHRCPGEGVTLTVLAAAVRTLARLSYDLPPQDLGCDDSVMPTRPRSGVVIRPR